MPHDKRFNFTPLSKKQRKIPTEIYGRFYLPGLLRLGVTALLGLNIDLKKGSFIRLYADIEKRTLGFVIRQSISYTDSKKDWRMVRVTAPKFGAEYSQISCQPFLKALGRVDLPSERLKVNSYQDTQLGVVYYITIPYATRKVDPVVPKEQVPDLHF